MYIYFWSVNTFYICTMQCHLSYLIATDYLLMFQMITNILAKYCFFCNDNYVFMPPPPAPHPPASEAHAHFLINKNG